MMTNKYNGRCFSCGARVSAGAGVAFKSEGAWAVACMAHKPEVTVTTVERILSAQGYIQTPTREDDNLPLIRALPGARWDSGSKRWNVSLSDADLPRALEVAERIGLKIDPALQARKAEIDQAAQARVTDPRLYPFQVAGVDYLYRHDRALLADQMGLGKTVQVASALAARPAPVIVVCPASLKYNWQKELALWAPAYETTVCLGRNSFRFPAVGEAVIINYDILPTLPDDMEGPAGLTVILDEVQYVKNYKARRSQKAGRLCELASRVWALTGTPLMNQPFDLWGILCQTDMARAVFGSFSRFLTLFRAQKRRHGGYDFGMPAPEVAERLRRVMIRRKRDEVLPDLPAKQWQDIEVNGLPASLIAELDAVAEILDFDDQELPPFSMFSKIRAALAASRVPAMLDIVEQYETSAEPLVVFSAHRAPIDALASRDGWEVITGDVSAADRQRIVDAFQAGSLKGIGLTIGAGNTGLTLTHAHHMLFVDLDWVPANNSQAEDRCARIGQTADSIHVMRLVSTHALDQHIHRLLSRKIAMAAAAIDHTTAGRRLASSVQVQTVALAPVNPADMEAVQDSLRLLAGVCDGACARDGVGFSGCDAGFGHSLARRASLSATQVKVAAGMLLKYHRQLGAARIARLREIGFTPA